MTDESKSTLQTFENSGEHGRVIVKCQDGGSVVLEPGQSATVWLHRGKFYHHEQTWWRRLARWWRDGPAVLFRKRAR